MSKYRILHAPVIGLYQVGNLVEISRGRGWEAMSVVWNLIGCEGLYHHVDENFHLMWTSSPPQSIEFRPLEFLLERIFDFDIFHFHYGYSILPPKWQMIPGRAFPSNLDLRMIREMGKKIVFQHWSCWAGRHEGFWRKDYPICDICRTKPYCYCKSDYIKALWDREVQYADMQINAHPDLESLIPGKSRHIPISVDTSLYDPSIPIPERFRYAKKKENNVLIYHSFNNRGDRGDVKGTSFIRQAVENLQRRGVPVELMYFESVPNLDVRFYQRQADIAVDQLLFPWHGSTGMECMASGKPVVCWIDQEWKREFHPDLPIVNSTPETIEKVLLDLIEHPEKRSELGRRGREYVQRTHSYNAVGDKLEQAYDELYREESPKCHYYVQLSKRMSSDNKYMLRFFMGKFTIGISYARILLVIFYLLKLVNKKKYQRDYENILWFISSHRELFSYYEKS